MDVTGLIRIERIGSYETVTNQRNDYDNFNRIPYSRNFVLLKCYPAFIRVVFEEAFLCRKLRKSC